MAELPPLLVAITPPGSTADELRSSVEMLAQALGPTAAPRCCVLLRLPLRSAGELQAGCAAVAGALVPTGMTFGVNVGAFAPNELPALADVSIRLLQLPERAQPVACWRDAMRSWPQPAALCRSVHDDVSASQAIAEGADFVALSPVLATASKPGGVPLGLEVLRAVCKANPRRVYALGGMDATNAEDALATGAVGVMAIRAAWSVGSGNLAAWLRRRGST